MNFFFLIDNMQGRFPEIVPYKLQKFQEEEAVKSHNKVFVTRKFPKLEEETRTLLNEIMESFDRSSDINKSKLEELQNKLLKHREYLQKEDEGTEVLKQLFTEISITESRIH